MADELHDLAERCAALKWRVIGLPDQERPFVVYSRERNYLALVNRNGLKRLLDDSAAESSGSPLKSSITESQ